jgi:hypothetical protein
VLENLLLSARNRGFADFALEKRQLHVISIRKVCTTNPTGCEKGRDLSFDSDSRFASESEG